MVAVWSPIFGRQASLITLPPLPVWVVMMAMSCVFRDSAPQGEKNSPPLYMRITHGWLPGWQPSLQMVMEAISRVFYDFAPQGEENRLAYT